MTAALAPRATVADYDRIFEAERSNTYPTVDSFECWAGFAIDRERLERAGRVLACPVKGNPPNWQHGRVLYALTRRYLADHPQDQNVVRTLDIGTAKGFSALAVRWAVMDAFEGQPFGHDAYSVDVMDPMACVRRNTVAEVGGLTTLYDVLEPWPESRGIAFLQSTGIDFLKRNQHRFHIVFVDGKHDGDVVMKEGKLIADRQERGDVVMFDDCQIPGVANAVSMLDCYDIEYFEVKRERKYAIGVRK